MVQKSQTNEPNKSAYLVAHVLELLLIRVLLIAHTNQILLQLRTLPLQVGHPRPLAPQVPVQLLQQPIVMHQLLRDDLLLLLGRAQLMLRLHQQALALGELLVRADQLLLTPQQVPLQLLAKLPQLADLLLVTGRPVLQRLDLGLLLAGQLLRAHILGDLEADLVLDLLQVLADQHEPLLHVRLLGQAVLELVARLAHLAAHVLLVGQVLADQRLLLAVRSVQLHVRVLHELHVRGQAVDLGKGEANTFSVRSNSWAHIIY